MKYRNPINTGGEDMKLNRCSGCKYYLFVDSECELFRSCDGAPDHPDRTDDMPVALDGEGYGAGFYCPPEFGCDEWVAK